MSGRRSAASRSAGKLGGRPRKERAVPPPEAATPAPARGRPSKCTPEMVTKLAAAFARCGRMEDAAAIVGIGYSTLKQWLTWGEAGREPYREILAKAKEQESLAVVEVMDKMRGHPDWRARLAWLDRVRPPKAKVAVESVHERVIVHLPSYDREEPDVIAEPSEDRR